jgi:hypothetical protein
MFWSDVIHYAKNGKTMFRKITWGSDDYIYFEDYQILLNDNPSTANRAYEFSLEDFTTNTWVEYKHPMTIERLKVMVTNMEASISPNGMVYMKHEKYNELTQAIMALE